MNQQDLDIEFADVTTSALQHYGIDLNTFVYVSPQLLNLRRLLPEKARVTVKWPSTDAGHVFVWDPIEQEYFRVPNKAPEYSGLTVTQARLAKTLTAENDPDHSAVAASAQERIREVVETAKASKKLKTRRRGARIDNDTSARYRYTEDQAQTQASSHITPPVAENEAPKTDVEIEFLGDEA
jgi:putative transposase